MDTIWEDGAHQPASLWRLKLLAFLITISSIIGFSAYWFFLSWLIARISGWAQLAEHYSASYKFEGELHLSRYGLFKNTSKYHKLLKVGISEEGLYLSMAAFFRVGHPPLLIPWGDISYINQKGRFAQIGFTNFPAMEIILSWNIFREYAERIPETKLNFLKGI